MKKLKEGAGTNPIHTLRKYRTSIARSNAGILLSPQLCYGSCYPFIVGRLDETVTNKIILEGKTSLIHCTICENAPKPLNTPTPSFLFEHRPIPTIHTSQVSTEFPS